MSYITSLAEFALVVQDKLEANMVDLGLKAVYYGDQNKLPTTPVACIEPDNKLSTLSGGFRKVDIELRVYVLLYHSSVGSPQDNRLAADQQGELVEALLNADAQLKRDDGTDRVIHCYVTEVSSGYATKGTALVRASRITFEGKSRNLLPG